ncbi:hypothetical protein HY29_16795 [Hyphomonas beringensis]|uniref:ATPase AAA-type core domain-containing protein n=1 Tax=Hyphomonas beringensis TaxID=1280946 RepID=A0A062UBW1_9PROT|nr:AAA family ATPase [Hyphomonas beringensis]KCZ53625.1 hypothetical protein HY29_16795 [Hyphomonas beringensis]
MESKLLLKRKDFQSPDFCPTIPSIELSKVTYLTGANGSGKTRWLKQIDSKLYAEDNISTLYIDKRAIGDLNANPLYPTGNEDLWVELQNNPYLSEWRQIAVRIFQERKIANADAIIDDQSFNPWSESQDPNVESARTEYVKAIDNTTRTIMRGTSNFERFGPRFLKIAQAQGKFVHLLRTEDLDRSGPPTNLAEIYNNYIKSYFHHSDENYRKGEKDIDSLQKTFLAANTPPWKLFDDALEELSCDLDADTYRFRISSPNLSEIAPKDSEVRFTPTILNEDGSSLGWDELSSGEQAMITVLTMLVGHAASNNSCHYKLILLDEVDASFHPDWCKKFGSLIEFFSERHEAHFIVATHSVATLAHARSSDYLLFEKKERKYKYQFVDRDKAIHFLSGGLFQLAPLVTYVQGEKGEDFIVISEGHNYRILRKFLNLENIKGVAVTDAEIHTTSHTQLKSIYRVFSAFEAGPTTLFVVDPDVNISDWPPEENRTFVHRLDPSTDKSAASGIESAFPRSTFEQSKISPNSKRKFAQWIERNGTKKDFVSFSTLKAKILDIQQRVQGETNSLNAG